jgi:hypothetical protein
VEGRRWRIESVPKTGNLQSKDEFADGQYHVEWMNSRHDRQRQGRGNSGIFIMGLYELRSSTTTAETLTA